MPEISIIIPVYNVEKYLEQCLESIRKQSFRDYEVIVVDDGSPDNSHVIYKRYKREDSRFRYIRQDNAGVSTARNTGLNAAHGKYVIFVDSDDWMPDDALKILHGRAVSTNADLTIADAWIAYENGEHEYVHVFADAFETSDKAFIRQYKKAILAFNENPFPYGGACRIPTGLGGPWNKLVKKELLDKYGINYDPYVKGIFDDCLFTLEILAHAERIAYINKPVYYYRMVSTSLLHKYKANILETNSRIFERIEAHISKYEVREEFEKAFSFYVSRRFNESLGTYFFAEQNPNQFTQNISALNKLIRSTPYKEAFELVDTTGMSKARRAICREAQKGHAFMIWLIFQVKQRKLLLSSSHVNSNIGTSR